ncbi:MAG TPA: MlaD family protein [Elusimicrobiota bacterium]|nr:MlaD family protein [Elusimicrobiota bacterium]
MSAPIPESRKQRRRAWLSPVWLVPLIAAGGLGWYAFREHSRRGPTIEILFREGDGLQAERTDLKFLGFTVGTVRKLTLSKDLRRVVAEVELDRTAEALAREGARFWVVRPRISAAGVTGLSTIVSGAYIEALPGQGPPKDRFEALAEPLPEEAPEGGLEIAVVSDEPSAFAFGTPVTYRGIKVGAIKDSSLTDDARSVLSQVIIDRPYRVLVRSNSVFWNAGGLHAHLGLTGLSVGAQSFAAAIEGGLAFATPDPPGPEAKAGARFPLNDKPKKEWDSWRPAIKLTRQPPQSLR